MPKCKIEWCKRRVFHKRLGLCGPHYQQAYQDAKQRRVPIEQGKPRVDVPLRGSLRGVAVCTQLGCDRCVWHEKTQLCEHHYWRNRRHGDPSHMERPRDRKCTVIECGALCPRKHKGHGLCKMHLDRKRADAMRRGIPFEQGDPLAVLVVRDPMRGCSVEGCPRPFDGTHNGREFCYFHYHRDYRGTPLSGPVTASAQRQRRFGKARRHLEWIIAHADSFSGVTEKVEDCHIWWYRRTRNGYAKVAPLEGEKGGDLVCRIICYRVHGDPPSQACQAGHICDRGHLGRVNPKHLEWQTHSEQGQARSRNYARKRAVALAQIPS